MSQQLMSVSVEKEILNFKIIFGMHRIFRFLFGNFCTEDMSLFCNWHSFGTGLPSPVRGPGAKRRLCWISDHVTVASGMLQPCSPA